MKEFLISNKRRKVKRARKKKLRNGRVKLISKPRFKSEILKKQII